MRAVGKLLATLAILTAVNAADAARYRDPDIPIYKEDLPIQYKMFRNVAFDVDSLLKDLGLTPLICTYWDYNKGYEVVYRSSLGACIFGSLPGLLSHPDAIGVIKVLFRDGDGASMGARVHWRPTRNGWADFYKEVSFLMFEGVRQTAYKVFKLKSEEKPLGYKESFLGEINIAFDRVPLPFRNWRGYDRFDFVFEPQDRIGPIGRYNGRLTVSHQAEIENERELKISFHTNWNMLNIDREFEFIGEIDESAK